MFIYDEYLRNSLKKLILKQKMTMVGMMISI